MAARYRPTLTRCRRLLARWQTLLGLGDWDIHLELVPRARVADGADGECTATFETRRAHILIAQSPPRGRRRNAWLAQSTSSERAVECTVCHELLHVLFAGHQDASGVLDAEGPALMLYEQAIDTLANTLVALYHRRGRGEDA